MFNINVIYWAIAVSQSLHASLRNFIFLIASIQLWFFIVWSSWPELSGVIGNDIAISTEDTAFAIK